MSLLVFSILFFPVMLSGLTVYLIKPRQVYLQLFTAFSGAYLLGITFLEIIPEIYSTGESLTIGLFVLIGFFIQLLLDFITRGIEHGHEHLEEKSIVHRKGYLNTWPVMIGLCIHSFLEGMPLAESNAIQELKTTMLTGIAIHNIPISVVLMSLLCFNCQKTKWIPVVLLLIFALSAPLGTIISNYTGAMLITRYSNFFDYILAVVVGIFLHISTTILFENDEHHSFNFRKLAVILLGFGTTIVLSLGIH